MRLYDLGDCNEKVVQLLSQLLSQILANADQPQSDRNRLKTQGNEKKITQKLTIINLAQEIATRYQQHAVEIERNAAATFHLILDLMMYFDL